MTNILRNHVPAKVLGLLFKIIMTDSLQIGGQLVENVRAPLRVLLNKGEQLKAAIGVKQNVRLSKSPNNPTTVQKVLGIQSFRPGELCEPKCFLKLFKNFLNCLVFWTVDDEVLTNAVMAAFDVSRGIWSMRFFEV